MAGGITTLTVAAAGVTVLAYLGIVPSKTATAQKTSFFCGQSSNGTPTTFFAHPVRGDVEVIRWTSNFGKETGYNPQKRCEEASPRFQKYHDQGVLSQITTGRKNGQDIICIAKAEGEPCLNDQEQGQLWTLKPGTNSNEILARLAAVRRGDTSKVLEENKQIWVDVKEILENNPVKSLF